jgi:hypothetical protein
VDPVENTIQKTLDMLQATGADPKQASAFSEATLQNMSQE